MRTNRYYQRSDALLALIALAVRLLFAVVSPQQFGIAATDDPLAAMGLCSVHGPQTASDAPGAPPPPATGEHCPACALTPLFLLAAFAALLAVAVHIASRPRRWMTLRLPPMHLRVGTRRSRAPPCLA